MHRTECGTTRVLAARTATSRTATGTTASSTSTRRTSTIAIRTCAPAWKYHEDESLQQGSFRSRYASHPAAIFEVSITFSCSEKYFFSSSTSSSWHKRIKRFATSSRIRSSFMGGIFVAVSPSAAFIESVRHSSTVPSTWAYKPNLSRLGIFLPV